MEIERKYLLDQLPENLTSYPCKKIEQGYLSTEPVVRIRRSDDAQALSYYNQCNELYNSAKKTYEERFEPLSAFGSQPLEDWDWNDGPMPWEGVK